VFVPRKFFSQVYQLLAAPMLIQAGSWHYPYKWTRLKKACLGRNALAYLEKEKKFYPIDDRRTFLEAPTPYLIGILVTEQQNFFSLSLTMQSNKLECLSLEHFFPLSLVFQSKLLNGGRYRL
jgi:hypothetical protein